MTNQQPGVAVVTGGSRGAGRGIAIGLGMHGYTVYVTGRSEQEGESSLTGTIHDTAASVSAVGGRGIAARGDHRDDTQVASLFDQVRSESGRLDILVNNAALIHDELLAPSPFWKKSLAASVDLIDVGLRSSLVASYYAAPLLIATKGSLVALTSAPGAVYYQFGPAYGAQKAGTDKFAADMAVDFEPYNVAVVSIWMGAVLTERLQRQIDNGATYLVDITESPEFTGHVIAALKDDPNLSAFSGRTLIGAELARQYGIVDRDGRQPPSFREFRNAEPANYRGIKR